MKNHKSWRRYIKMLCLVFPQGKQRNGNKLLCYFLLKKYIYFKSNNQLLPNHWVWVVKNWSQGRNGQSDILAVLVVIFADVAEVRCKGLNSQGTWDLPTFPLNDHTCHKHTYHKLRARPTAEKHEPPERTHFLHTPPPPGQRQGTQERGKEALLYTREAAQTQLIMQYYITNLDMVLLYASRWQKHLGGIDD